MDKILVVDSDYGIRLLYEEELTEEGYEVITWGGHEGLLETINEERPNRIVLDSEVGKCDGLDVLKDIRNSCHDMPVILCTGFANSKNSPESVSADDYVVKTWGLSELKRKVKRALRHSSGSPTSVDRNGTHGRKAVPVGYTRLNS